MNIKPPSFALLLGIGLIPCSALASTEPSILCETGIHLPRGEQLIYRLIEKRNLKDNVKFTDLATEIAPFTLSILRDKPGRTLFWMNQGIVEPYEKIAPDADYSKIPFEKEFRSPPNDGRGLYAAPSSARGLFISIRPLSQKPQRIQIVHYLSATQFLRSPIRSCQ